MTVLPLSGRLAGIDYGTVRIGVSVSDPGQRFASPLETHARGNAQQDERWIVALVAEHQIVGFVVGLPIHNSGKESEKSREARQFAAWLEQQTSRPVQLFDERYTTVEADAILAQTGSTRRTRKANRDKLAAQVLLQSFLESTRQTDTRGLES